MGFTQYSRSNKIRVLGADLSMLPMEVRGNEMAIEAEVVTGNVANYESLIY